MRPKRNHWCVIGFVDGTPLVALCAKANSNSEADHKKYPKLEREAEFWTFGDRLRTETFGHHQVIAVLGKLEIPEVPVQHRKTLLKK
jgi:hypothetical protein